MMAMGATPERARKPSLGRHILLWTQRSLIGVLASCALVYVGDCAVYYLRGKPVDQIQVTTYMAAPLKNDKTAYYFEGSGPMPCAMSLFPQAGLKPCWYLRRHPLYADQA